MYNFEITGELALTKAKQNFIFHAFAGNNCDNKSILLETSKHKHLVLYSLRVSLRRIYFGEITDH